MVTELEPSGTTRSPAALHLVKTGPYENVAVTVSTHNGVSAYTPESVIAAVEKELDGIFIRRADLPEVIEDGDGYRISDTRWLKRLAHKNAAGIRRDALDNLALAEYLDAHPPVDEADVEALADAIAKDPGWHSPSGPSTPADMARRLLSTGKVQVVK